MQLRLTTMCCFVLSISLTASSAEVFMLGTDVTTANRSSTPARIGVTYETHVLSKVSAKPVARVTPVSTLSQTPKALRQTAKLTTSSLPPRPRFEERAWIDLSGVQFAFGKSLGISKDVIWIQTRRGSVIRKPLVDLHPKDRQHAQAKRQAILDYRQLKKNLEL